MGMRKLSEQHPGAPWPKWGEIFQFASGGAHLMTNQRPTGGGGGASALDDLTDVEAGSPADGEVIKWINANSAWESASVGALTAALDDLTDVDAAAPADAEVLTWVNANSAWESAAASGGGDLDDLNDVSVPSPTDGHVLKWINANSSWESASAGALTAALDDLTDVDAASPADTEVLTWVNANSAWEAAAAAGGGGGGGTHRWHMFSPPAGGSTYPLIVVNATGTIVKVRVIHRGSGDVDINVTKNLRGTPSDVMVSDLTSSDTAWTASSTLSVGVVSGDELDVELVGVTGNVELVTVQVEIS
jgi:hypothetical protein